MVAGRPNIDYPGADTALSVVPLGQDDALTSRVRHIGAKNMHVTSPRNGVGEAVSLQYFHAAPWVAWTAPEVS